MKMLSQIKDSVKHLYVAAVITGIFFSCNRRDERDTARLVIEKMPDGSTRVIGATINGKKEGLWIEYDDSGRLSSQQTYIHDSLSGETIGYHDDGKTIFSKGIIKNGRREGEWTIYYDRDKIAERGHYSNGEKVGIWEYYLENGKLNKKVEYTGTGKKVILDNHLLLPVPDELGPAPIEDSNNNVHVEH